VLLIRNDKYSLSVDKNYETIHAPSAAVLVETFTEDEVSCISFVCILQEKEFRRRGIV